MDSGGTIANSLCSGCIAFELPNIGFLGHKNNRLSSRLPVEARDSVCEQCHLSGSARVLNPGKGWADFVPGVPLEEVFSVYTDDVEGSGPLTVRIVRPAQ